MARPKLVLPSRSCLAPLFLVAALVLAGCSKSDSASGQAGSAIMPPPEVAVVTVKARALPVEMEFTGQTAGSREVEVRSRVPGILQKRLFEEGSQVKAGQPMFQIDPASFQNQVATNEAAVAIAQARVSQAQREDARLVPLAAASYISQRALDDSKSALETAQAQLLQAQAQLSDARLNLSYTKVVAPISGTTGTLSKSEGSLISGTDTLLTTLVQTNPVYVNFSVAEADLMRMSQQLKAGTLDVPGKRAANGSLGFTVRVKLVDGSFYPISGKLNFASERVNVATGSFDMRAELPNPAGALRPGQFVRVFLGGATHPDSLSVPQRAVIDSPFGKIVFVVTPEDKLEPRPVVLDTWTQGQWIVSKGLKDGERVLVDGFIKAHDPGMQVKPVPFQEPTSAPQAPAK
jgi:membrane fusion protein, multidrug efflux system